MRRSPGQRLHARIEAVTKRRKYLLFITMASAGTVFFAVSAFILFELIYLILWLWRGTGEFDPFQMPIYVAAGGMAIVGLVVSIKMAVEAISD